MTVALCTKRPGRVGVISQSPILIDAKRVAFPSTTRHNYNNNNNNDLICGVPSTVSVSDPRSVCAAERGRIVLSNPTALHSSWEDRKRDHDATEYLKRSGRTVLRNEVASWELEAAHFASSWTET